MRIPGKVTTSVGYSFAFAALCSMAVSAGVAFADEADSVDASSSSDDQIVSDQASNAPVASEKAETVYVFAKPDGSVKNTEVSTTLKNPDASTELADSSVLTDIENAESSATFTGTGSSMVWDTYGENIYYTGKTDKEAPVSISISYFLDGKKVDPDSLAGKSGKLKIRYDYENNATFKATINGKKETLYVPFTFITAMLFDNENFKNAEVTNGKLIDDGDRAIVAGYAMPGLSKSLGKIADDFDLPEYFEVEADVTDFEMKTSLTIATAGLLEDFDSDDVDTSDVEDASSELSDAMGQIIDGAGELQDGLDKIADGAKSANVATGKLAEGADALASGSLELAGGLTTLAQGTSALPDGVSQLADGSSALAAGLPSAADGAGALADGAGTLGEGLGTLKEGMEQAVDGTDQLIAGAGQVSGGIGLVVSGDGTEANPGLTGLKPVMKQISDGITAVKEQLVAMKGKLGDAAGGLGSISEGAAGISAGADSISAGANGLQEAVAGSNTAIGGAVALLSSIDTDSLSDADKETLMKALGALGQVTSDGGINAKISGGLDAIGSGAGEIKAGADGIKVGADQIADGLTEGIAPLDAATAEGGSLDQLAAGASAVETGIGAYGDALGKISDGVNTDLVGGLETLKEGQESAVAGLGDKKTEETLIYGANALEQGASQLKGDEKSGLTQAANGADALADGIAQLKDKLPGMIAGINKIVKGSGSLSDGAAALADGAHQLDDGLGTLADGTDAAADGGGSLVDGLNQFNDEGIGEITDLIDEDLLPFTDRLDAITNAAKEYDNFAGITKGTKGSVKFIFEVDPIEKSEE